jgi:hypothetical protein
VAEYLFETLSLGREMAWVWMLDYSYERQRLGRSAASGVSRKS